MGFKLPRLETDVDCEPLGYPKLLLRFWLNPWNPEEAEEWVPPDERDPPVDEPEPWDRLWYWSIARVLQCVIIPGTFSDTGKDEEIDIPDMQAVYDLERMPGFEQKMLNWALETLQNERLERLKAARKN